MTHKGNTLEPELNTTTTNNQFPELTEEEYQELTEPLTGALTPALDLHSITTPEEVLVTVTFNDRATEEDKESTERPHSTLVTKAAMAIERVTGHSQILTELDFLRNKLKSYKATSTRKVPSQDEKEEYGILLAKLQTIANTNINDLKRDIKTYEKDYYHTHHAFPNESTAYYKQLCKKLHRGKILVSRWADFTL